MVAGASKLAQAGRVPIPVYALGGIQSTALPKIDGAGAAGISMFRTDFRAS